MKRRGFTLIEGLIVTAIIIALLAIAVPAFLRSKAEAKWETMDMVGWSAKVSKNRLIKVSGEGAKSFVERSRKVNLSIVNITSEPLTVKVYKLLSDETPVIWKENIPENGMVQGTLIFPIDSSEVTSSSRSGTMTTEIGLVEIIPSDPPTKRLILRAESHSVPLEASSTDLNEW